MILLKRLTIPALKHLREVDLWLPRRGAVLIEGPNESGKSTLFEAIYFALYGRPLVGEEPGRATLAALLPHDGAQAQVTLCLVTGETALEVTRTLTRARNGALTSEASLLVRQPGQPDERINAVSAVNDRLLAELHGLDGDTLRNSCFMEQKGLERLESLRRDEREEAISRLLGLERLVAAERSLSPSADERRLLERLREQATLAQQRRMAQEAVVREGDVAQRLRAAELREWLEERDTLVARLDYLAEEDARLQDELRDQEALLSQLDTLRAAERRLAGLERIRWQARQSSHETSQLTAQLTQLTAIEEGQAPEAERRLDDIHRLEAGLREVASERGLLGEASDLEQRAQAAEEAQRQAHASLNEADRNRSEAATLLARAQARDTLAAWILARERAEVREGRTQQLAALNIEREQYQREIAEMRAHSLQWMALTGAAAALGLVTLALTLAIHVEALWVVVAMATIATVGLGWRWRQEVSVARARAWKLEQADQGVSTVRAEVNLAQRLVNDDIGRLEAGLRAAGLPIPVTVEAGERTLRDLPTAGNIAIVEEQAFQAETQAARARVALERAQGDAASARSALRNLGFTDNLEQIQQRAEAVEAAAAALVAEARELGLPEDLAGLMAARGAAEVTFTSLLSSVGDRDAVYTRLLASNDTLDEALRTWAAELQAVASALAPLDLATAAQLTTSLEAPALEAPTLEAQHSALAAEIHQALSQRDEQAARARQSGLIAERERLSTRAEESHAAQQRLLEQIRERMASLDAPVQGDEPLATLAQAWPLLGEVTAAEVAQLRAARDDARLETYHSEQSVAERERATMIESAPLDERNLRDQLEATERDLRLRELAARLASETRAHIIRRALPETELYMRAILPELTAGRYHDVTLLRDDTTGATSEADLVIRMWDQFAGRYVRKNLFSGGTRDQASLALRLSFALATLPRARGATPGFIFLDEPLSAFDAERSLALARVLTTGAIAQTFAQVFLISHSQVIEPRTFDYTLRMEQGRVTESSLPNGALAESLWSAEASLGAGDRISASA